MTSVVACLAILLAATNTAACPLYTLTTTYNLTNFFDEFEFLNRGLYVVQKKNGTGKYVDANGSRILSLVGPEEQFGRDEFYIGVDIRNMPSYRRHTIHVVSKTTLTNGLLIARFRHLPEPACGVSSTFSALGNQRRRRAGIILSHGSNGESRGNYLHGFWPRHVDNRACAKLLDHFAHDQCFTSNKTFGCEGRSNSIPRVFHQGAIYAIKKTQSSISFYSWTYHDAPKDIHTSKPQPENWGPPMFELPGIICSGVLQQFDALRMHFAIDFCPESLTSVADCLGVAKAADCPVFVRQSGVYFRKMFWHVQDIRVFHDSTEPSQQFNSTNSLALTTSSPPLTTFNRPPLITFSKPPFITPTQPLFTFSSPLITPTQPLITSTQTLIAASPSKVMVEANILANATRSATTFTARKYREVESYNMKTFLDKFDFSEGHHAADTEYLGRQEAREQYLVGSFLSDSRFWVGLDDTGKYLPRQRRPSVLLVSKKAYKNGLIIGRFYRIPEPKCGVRASFSTIGTDGDGIVIYDSSHGHSMLFTRLSRKYGTCKAIGYDAEFFCDPEVSRKTGLSNCLSHYRLGPAVADTMEHGGAYAMERTEDYIRVFGFHEGEIPANLDSDSPDPETWGVPIIQVFKGKHCNLDKLFSAQKLTLEMGFCPPLVPWHTCQASRLYDSCGSFIREEPTAFNSYMFEVTDIRVFSKEDETEFRLLT